MKGKRALVVAAVVMMMAAILVVTAVATTGNKTATLYYNNIGIKLDGEEIVPKDANGNTVEPFIIDGTTYLPVRAVSGALGLDVAWDGTTDTVVLTTKKEDSSATGEVLVDQNGVKITYLGAEYDDYGYYYNVKILIENNSDVPVMVQTRDESVNGYMVDGIISCSVVPGKKANDEITFYVSDLENSGIEKVETVEFYFAVANDDTWQAIFYSDIITITP